MEIDQTGEYNATWASVFGSRFYQVSKPLVIEGGKEGGKLRKALKYLVVYKASQ